MNDTVPHDKSGGAASASTVRGLSGSTVGPSGSHYIIGPLQKASGPRKKEKTAMSHFWDRHHSTCIAVFPILADVVDVKTSSWSTAHWSNDFIRLNGWVRTCFAQLLTPLDIDGIGQNWEESNICPRTKVRYVRPGLARNRSVSGSPHGLLGYF